jgi:hypothetical protein
MPDDVSGRAWRYNFPARPIHDGFKGNRRPWVRVTPALRKVCPMKRLAILTMAELLKFAGKVKEQRKATAEKLFTDRVMTREELIKHGFLSENDVN